MSQGQACRCPRENYRVVTRNANYSAFNGYHRTPSEYSAVTCICCGAAWRTKAKWVDSAPGIDEVARQTRGAAVQAGSCTHPRPDRNLGFQKNTVGFIHSRTVGPA